MKKLFKIVSIMALLTGFTACEVEDKNPVVEPGDKPVLVSPEEGTSYVLDPANPANPAITVVWNHAKYSVSTEVNYNVEIAKSGTEFATPVSLQITTARQISLTNAQFNAKVLEAGLTPFTAGSLDIRVKASLGTSNVMEVISNKITINITPFTTDLPKIAVTGAHQGWDPTTAPLLAASAFGKSDYEGFVWLNGEFKFATPNPTTGVINWPSQGGGPDYGDDGTFSGILANPGVNITASSGYYYIKANTKPTSTNNPNGLSYSLTPTSWAIIGNGTPGGWSTDTPMTYNPSTKKWTVTVTLTTQSAPDNGMKFRANGSWDINLGDTNADGSLEFSGTNISTTAGTHTITLDLSNPRKYTYSIQ